MKDSSLPVPVPKSPPCWLRWAPETHHSVSFPVTVLLVICRIWTLPTDQRRVSIIMTQVSETVFQSPSATPSFLTTNTILFMYILWHHGWDEWLLTISLAFTSHLYFSNSSTIASWPSYTAKCNGVRSTFVRASLLMPARKSTSHVSKWLFIAAICSGDVPSWKQSVLTIILYLIDSPSDIIIHTQSVVNGAPRLISSCTLEVSPSFAQTKSIFPKSIMDTVDDAFAWFIMLLDSICNRTKTHSFKLGHSFRIAMVNGLRLSHSDVNLKSAWK